MTEHYTQDTQTVNTQQNLIPKRGNAVFRQELKSLTPKCDVNCAIFCNFSLMILFFAFGIPILVAADDVQEYKLDYTNCVNDELGYCNMTVKVERLMNQPVYLYYEIENFYMNHRDFVKSRNFAQLRGDVHVDSTGNSKCVGAKYVWEIFDNITSLYKTYTGNPLNGDDYANPCGLIAKSYFNDTNFKVVDSKENEIFINEKGIANDYDRQFMFKRLANSSLTQWIDVENGKKSLYLKSTLLFGCKWNHFKTFVNFGGESRKIWNPTLTQLELETVTITKY